MIVKNLVFRPRPASARAMLGVAFGLMIMLAFARLFVVNSFNF